MTALEKRLKNLKLFLDQEEVSADRSQTYIDDLKLSIETLERQLPTVSKDGYQMVT